MKTWTQQEIGAEVARTSGVAADAVNKTIGALLGAVTEGLKGGKEVLLADFGRIWVASGKPSGQVQVPGSDGGQALAAKSGVNADALPPQSRTPFTIGCSPSRLLP